MNSWFTSDWHEGHRNIGKFRRIPEYYVSAAEQDCVLANSIWLHTEINQLVGRNDTLYYLGDAAFTQEGLDSISSYHGRKVLYGGNHDDLPVKSFLKVFDKVRGCERRKQFWLSHFPIHPDELRGRFCIHGHVHYNTINDWRYINVCCDNLQEQIGQPVISLDSIRKTKGTEIIL